MPIFGAWEALDVFVLILLSEKVGNHIGQGQGHGLTWSMQEFVANGICSVRE